MSFCNRIRSRHLRNQKPVCGNLVTAMRVPPPPMGIPKAKAVSARIWPQLHRTPNTRSKLSRSMPVRGCVGISSGFKPSCSMIWISPKYVGDSTATVSPLRVTERRQSTMASVHPHVVMISFRQDLNAPIQSTARERAPECETTGGHVVFDRSRSGASRCRR